MPHLLHLQDFQDHSQHHGPTRFQFLLPMAPKRRPGHFFKILLRTSSSSVQKPGGSFPFNLKSTSQPGTPAVSCPGSPYPASASGLPAIPPTPPPPSPTPTPHHPASLPFGAKGTVLYLPPRMSPGSSAHSGSLGLMARTFCLSPEEAISPPQPA